MSAIIPFNFDGAAVRVVTIDGEPWFLAADVASALGYANTSKAVNTHCKAVQTCPTETGGQVRHVQAIPERDVYRLVMRSKLPAAERFEEWVVGEVLPSIRKTGNYSAAPAVPQSLPEALRLAADLAERNGQLQQVVAEQSTKVDALDRIATADGAMCITNAAKDLQVRPKDLFAWLQAHQWIYRRAGGSGWVAYQNRIQQGVLEHKVTTVTRGDGSEKVAEQVLVTAKGLAKLAAESIP
ncbi:phage antirepressor KilAC domain-containing protein [Pseudomonas leptonychotis]|uniref:phage antirepressor KilAC domain-containing protein n=1 Tax=Pseudomonas leptonychotis TaxID=2448482 RepID=UPI003868C341